ncbi:MAG: MerR family transcriptional regulator [Chloroflexota bacterium]
MSKLLFTIGDVAELVGITAKTIRHYHKIGLLPEPIRDSNNYRMYNMAQLETLQHIMRLKQFGLSLKQIKVILDSDQPDAVAKLVLKQHEQRLQRDIQAMQSQLSDIQLYLVNDEPFDEPRTTPTTSAITILSDTVRRQSTGLSDALVALEADALRLVDNYEWSDGYEAFWHYASDFVVDYTRNRERIIIFWLERYFALRDMEIDDLQGQAWINEIEHSQARLMLARAFSPPPSPIFSQKDQERLVQMVPMLLFEQASPLQKVFLQKLLAG